LWSAETASHIVDMVHFASTEENNSILTKLKTSFRNGIVVPQKNIPDYVQEDDAILVGPGMVRGEKTYPKVKDISSVFALTEEADITRGLVRYLINNFPEKRFVFDAGAVQMMDAEWLKDLKTKAIVTPHQLEFETLFGKKISDLSDEEKVKAAEEAARTYNCVIILKAVIDIVTDGETTYVVRGGNQGLTKGGSGDVLAGLAVALFAKNGAVPAAVLASYIVKSTADELEKTKGYWYNTEDLVAHLPRTIAKIAI
jgi:hydroxyethylthiazole kinase-like uncharacterized protein yjeF